jgi:hypothetical protein
LFISVTFQEESVSSPAANVREDDDEAMGPASRTVYRALTGAPTGSASAGTGSLGWVRLTRNTNTYTAFYSGDGNTWTQLGTTQTIPSPQTVYVGLAVTGSINANTATFDNVSITAGSSLPNPVISGIAPLSGAPGTLLTISGSGSDPAQMLCCAAGCNFQFGLDEKQHPSHPGVGADIHVQFTPATAANVKNHPEWPNGIHGDLPQANSKCACGTGAL